MTSELDDLGDVLTVREVARVLRINKDAAYAAIHRGQIKNVISIGRSLRVPKASLIELLEGPRPSKGDPTSSAGFRRPANDGRARPRATRPSEESVPIDDAPSSPSNGGGGSIE